MDRGLWVSLNGWGVAVAVCSVGCQPAHRALDRAQTPLEALSPASAEVPVFDVGAPVLETEIRRLADEVATQRAVPAGDLPRGAGVRAPVASEASQRGSAPAGDEAVLGR